MTSLLDGRADLDVLEAPDLDHLADDPGQHVPEDEERTVSAVTLALAVVSAALSSAGAAWMVGGVSAGATVEEPSQPPIARTAQSAVMAMTSRPTGPRAQQASYCISTS